MEINARIELNIVFLQKVKRRQNYAEVQTYIMAAMIKINIQAISYLKQS
jgi:hypothetical protein